MKYTQTGKEKTIKWQEKTLRYRNSQFPFQKFCRFMTYTFVVELHIAAPQKQPHGKFLLQIILQDRAWQLQVLIRMLQELV